MIAHIVELVQLLALLETDDGEPGWLLLAGPAAGVATYTMLYRYYRNTDKSHGFEHEPTIEAQPVSGSDAKVDEVRGTTRCAIQGRAL